MRILFAVHAFPPCSSAGVEVYTLRLARALIARGHAVRVVAAVHDLGSEPYSTRRRAHEGVDVCEVVSVHPRGTLEATYADPSLDAALEPILREFRPDCVHVQHLINLSCGVVPAARALGSRVVLTLHDYWLSCPRDGLRMREDGSLCRTMDHGTCARCLAGSPYLVPPLQRGLAGTARVLGIGAYLHRLHDRAPRLTESMLRLVRRASPASGAPALRLGMDRRAAALRAIVRDVDVFLAPSSFARDRAVEFGVPAEKARVLPYGVLRTAPRPRPPGPRPRVGFVGTLAPHKGADVLIAAFRGLTDRSARLSLHGSETVSPAYVRKLRRAAAGDTRVRFHGPFAEAEQEQVFREIDVLAVPSIWWENSPLTVLEALGGGCPVVASRTGGVPELITEGVGVLVPPGDEAALRDALVQVTSGALLGEARAPLALKTAQEHAAELEDVYRGA